MSLQQKTKNKDKIYIQIKKLQDEVLKKVQSYKRRPKLSIKNLQDHKIKNKSYQKIITKTPEKKYSIEKAHERYQIEFMSNILKTKQLSKKMSIKLKIQKFSLQHIIGCGTFGKVWKAEDKSNHKLYAIKQISKPLALSKKGLGTVMNQRNIITQLHHYLIPKLIASFQTELNLYLVLPLMQKGDLRYHITKFKQFQQKQVRFFIACVVSALQYLRNCNIIHRDIKPENLLIDQSGYLHLSDFGVAIKYTEAFAGNCCGTPAYMAPEVIFQKQFTFTADYYALGVILYQMMIGERPYITSNRQQLKILMWKQSAYIKKDAIPQGWSIQSADFANKLLHRNPHNRLGFNHISQIKNHPWLRDFPWDQLQRRQIISPYCQSFNHWQVNFKQFLAYNNKQQTNTIQNSLLKGDLQQLFYQFTYEAQQKNMEYTTKPSYQLKS